MLASWPRWTRRTACSLRGGRARRRYGSGMFCWYAGTMLPRFFLFVGRPVMPGIMAGSDQLVQTVRAAVAVYFQGRHLLCCGTEANPHAWGFPSCCTFGGRCPCCAS